ncbi:MAG: type VI secretion system accessory protein TagJ [Zavarzinella sp.]
MDFYELLEEGRLSEALEHQLQQWRSSPGTLEVGIPLIIVQVMLGNWLEARQLLQAIPVMDQDEKEYLDIWSHLLTCDEARQQPNVVPTILGESLPWLPTWEKVFRLYDQEIPDSLLDEWEQLQENDDLFQGNLPGTINGEPFETFLDPDERWHPMLELFTERGWSVIPFPSVRVIDLQTTEDMMDLLYRYIEVRLHSGEIIRGRTPRFYRLTCQSNDPEIQSGVSTEFTEPNGLMCCRGERNWIIEEEPTSVMEDVSIEFPKVMRLF